MENQKKQPLNKKAAGRGWSRSSPPLPCWPPCTSAPAPRRRPGKRLSPWTVAAHGEEEAFTIETDAEYLRGALESIDLIEGSESEYGLFVTAVNGIAADDSKQEWWCFTKGGEEMMTGVDTTPIADGDAFEITLTEGY